MTKILVNLFSLVILGIIQVSFLTTWLPPISNLNLILSLVIFLTVIINYQKGLWWALGGGLFLELYSGLNFGVTTLSLILVVVEINFLFNNFFTNRSLYSLMILGFLGSLTYNLLVLIFSLVASAFGVFSLGINFWLYFFWPPILNLVILAIIFFSYYISTVRLKNIFLFHSSGYETKGKF
ncbi:MAG: hypothetical protein WC675_00620 [Patescibacteria group bacterium]|jgi:hypothetical protein